MLINLLYDAIKLFLNIYVMNINIRMVFGAIYFSNRIFQENASIVMVRFTPRRSRFNHYRTQKDFLPSHCDSSCCWI